MRNLILGTGQDASYLAEILLERGDEVHVLHRRSSADNLFRIGHLLDRVMLHQGDLTDISSLIVAVDYNSSMDQVWNMADQDHVGFSNDAPQVSVDVTYGGVQNVLEAVRTVQRITNSEVRIFQPLSITMFGNAPAPQNEETPLAPQSPYACAKAAAWLLCKHHRREHGLDVRCAIFANHDSPRRQGDYLLHKIVRQALAGTKFSVPDVSFDVGFAGDYMHDAVSIMNLPEPDDFVIGSGVLTSANQLATTALRMLDPAGLFGFEVGMVVDQEPRPKLCADMTKARSRFALHPRKPLRELVGEIVDKYRREQR